MAPRIPAEERQLNLIVALMATQRGVTKEEILLSVSGYRQRADGSRQALEKLFDRDKDDLRTLGVPIETVGAHADPNDLREARYRIPQAEYDLPDDLEFTPAELAVLGVAGGVWSEGSLSAEARDGLRKIRATGGDADEPIIGFAPRMTTREEAFGPLQQAIDEAAEVAFDYLKPGDELPAVRTLRPYSLVDFEARWHVVGWDAGADAERTFLLSRISGDVRRTGERFDPALRDGAGERAAAELAAIAARQTALIEVHAGTEAELRLRRRALPAEQGIRVPYVDLHVFADELASYGPEARVVAPDALRDAVVGRLRAAADLHGGVSA